MANGFKSDFFRLGRQNWHIFFLFQHNLFSLRILVRVNCIFLIKVGHCVASRSKHYRDYSFSKHCFHPSGMIKKLKELRVSIHKLARWIGGRVFLYYVFYLTEWLAIIPRQNELRTLKTYSYKELWSWVLVLSYLFFFWAKKMQRRPVWRLKNLFKMAAHQILSKLLH